LEVPPALFGIWNLGFGMALLNKSSICRVKQGGATESP
jgi:hypothetical protein